MKKETNKVFCVAGCLLAAFILWTVVLCFVDVRKIGPQGSAVGLATVNGFVHRLTGTNMTLYAVTDWLGLVPLGIVLLFAAEGLAQWVRRKSIRQVDGGLLVLGGFYVVVMAAYLFFETVVVNYRPVLIEGALEVSYPSSTTMLVLCVMPTALMQWNARMKKGPIQRCGAAAIVAFTAFMVIGRLLSGVHWLTDIIGGALLSAGLVMLYRAIGSLIRQE